MKSRLVIAALLAAMVFAVVARHFFNPRAESAANRHAGSQAGSPSGFKIVPRKASASALPRQAKAQSAADAYAQFEEWKTCFDNAGTPSVIQQEIVELRGAKYSPDLKQAFENEIHRKETQLAILAKCGDTQVTQDELSRLLEQAARQGDSAAQLKYAEDPMIDRGHSIENLGRLRAWRDTALGYVQSAVGRGNPEAMTVLAEAYDPLHAQASNEPLYPGMYLGAIVSPDAETAYRYYYQSKLTGAAPAWVDAELRTLEDSLTQDQIVAAKQSAQSAQFQHP